MKTAKQFLLVAASFFVAVMAFTVLAPRRVEAFVAALVQVSNTTANPVPVEQGDKARHLVRLSAEGFGDQSSIAMTDPTNGDAVYTVPAGKRLEIVQANLFAEPGSTGGVFAYWFNGFSYTPLPVSLQLPGSGKYAGSIPMHDYFDAGQQVLFSVSAPGGSPGYLWEIAANGYLIDCNGAC